MYRKCKTNRAFTLVEILTTMAIIGILLAVLIPALSQVSKKAQTVKQRAQFHTIEMGLEAFRTDTGDYPPSEWNTAVYGTYSASQRLAEAIIGRDGFGFHPASLYRFDGKGDIDNDGIADPTGAGSIYNVQAGVTCSSGYVQTAAENRAVRKGPYLELESSNAVRLGDYAVNYGTLVNATLPTYVLADSYKTAKLKAGRKTGMPILYYKANRMMTGHNATPPLAANTYNVLDSIGGNGIASVAFGQSMTDAWFYQRTRNPNFVNPPRPYRAESFILQSAGADGTYGTVDDVFNFEEEK